VKDRHATLLQDRHIGAKGATKITRGAKATKLLPLNFVSN